MNPLDWITFIERIGMPSAALIGVLVVVYKIGMKAVNAYMDDQKSKREERTIRAGHEKELLGLYTQLSSAIQLLRETNEKQNDANERQSASFVKALDSMTGQLAEMPKAWLAGLSDVYNKADQGHQNIILQVGKKIDLAQMDLTEAIDTRTGEITGAVRADGERLVSVEAQLQSLPAALAGALAKEFAPVVNEWKAFRSDIEYMLGDQFKEGLRAALNEHQTNLERALTQAAKSTIETVTAEVKRLAVTMVPPTPADVQQTVAPDPLAAPTKRATGTLSAVAADVTPPDAKRDDAKREAEAT